MERTRAGEIQRVLWVTLVLNATAAVVKLVAGFASGSLGLLAGGVDSLSDGAANVAGLVAVRTSARPADHEHPYGHRKFETLVSAAIAGGLFLTAGRLAWGAIDRMIAPSVDVLVSGPILAAPAIAVAINSLTALYERRAGRRLGSELLTADAAHTLADAAASAAVFVGLILVDRGWVFVDALVALGIAAVVARVGWSLLRNASEVLADAAALDPSEIGRLAKTVDGVEGAHKIRSRGPEDHVAVDLHIQVDPALGIGRAHEIGHQVSGLLSLSLPGVEDVVVHVEPALDLLEDEVTRIVHHVLGQHSVGAHEVRVVMGERNEVSLHLEFPPDITLAEAHTTATHVERDLKARVPEIERVVTHLEPGTRAADTAHAIARADHYEALLREVATAVPHLYDPHDIEVLGVDQEVRLSAHLTAKRDLSLAEAHRYADQLEALLRARSPELERITLHVEPEDD